MADNAGRANMLAGKVPGDTGPYHHGDLRRELLRLARNEIARSGADGVTLSALARLAGVSQPAPYRHFADRRALLRGVAEAGFEEFNMVLANAAAELSPQAGLHALSLAYVQFGERNRELYRLMFASRLVPEAPSGSGLASSADKAFDQLRRVVQELSPPESTERKALLTWAQLHGLVMLGADGFVTGAVSHLLDSPDDGCTSVQHRTPGKVPEQSASARRKKRREPL